MSQARIGDYVKPDSWEVGDILQEDNIPFRDKHWHGAQFRLRSGAGLTIAINIVVGEKVEGDEYRCKIEFPQYGKESQWDDGIIVIDEPNQEEKKIK